MSNCSSFYRNREIQLHLFRTRTAPTRAEVLHIWRAAKAIEAIPSRWTFARNGELAQVWGGWALIARS